MVTSPSSHLDDFEVAICGGGPIAMTLVLDLCHKGMRVAWFGFDEFKSLPLELSVALSPLSIDYLKQISSSFKNLQGEPFRQMEVSFEVCDFSLHLSQPSVQNTLEKKELGRVYTLNDLNHCLYHDLNQLKLQGKLRVLGELEGVDFDQKVEGGEVSSKLILQAKKEVSDNPKPLKQADLQTITSDWLLVADGLFSSIRQSLGIKNHANPYPHFALQAVVAFQFDEIHSKNQNPYLQSNECWQCFFDGLPLALLPFTTPFYNQPQKEKKHDGIEPNLNPYALVWTLDEEQKDFFQSLKPNDLEEKITQTLKTKWPQLKATQLLSPLSFRPLWRAKASSFLAKRVCLVGDCAHSIHPLAGQGLNLGLKGAFFLCQSLENAKNNHPQQFIQGDIAPLQRWAIDYQLDATLNQNVMDSVLALAKFSNQPVVSSALHSYSPNLTLSNPAFKAVTHQLKNLLNATLARPFVRYASGQKHYYQSTL